MKKSFPNYAHILHNACRTGNLDLANRVLEKDNGKSVNLNSCLLTAIKNDRHSIAELLLEYCEISQYELDQAIQYEKFDDFKKIVSHIVKYNPNLKLNYGSYKIIENKLKYYHLLHKSGVSLGNYVIEKLALIYIRYHGDSNLVRSLCYKLKSCTTTLVYKLIWECNSSVSPNYEILVDILDKYKLSRKDFVQIIYSVLKDGNKELLEFFLKYEDRYRCYECMYMVKSILRDLQSNNTLECLYLYLRHNSGDYNNDMIIEYLDSGNDVKRNLNICYILCLLFQYNIGTISQEFLKRLSESLTTNYGSFLLLDYPKDILHYILKITIILP